MLQYAKWNNINVSNNILKYLLYDPCVISYAQMLIILIYWNNVYIIYYNIF